MTFRAGTAYGFEVGSDSQDWRLNGACGRYSPEDMWPLPADDSGIAFARGVCAMCPAATRIECLTDGVKAGDWESVRGGFTGAERLARHKEGFAPADYPPPQQHVGRWCVRCASPFPYNPCHPYRRICGSCDARSKASARARARANSAGVSDG